MSHRPSQHVAERPGRRHCCQPTVDPRTERSDRSVRLVRCHVRPQAWARGGTCPPLENVQHLVTTFSYLALTVWNGLPLNIRLSQTLDTFKRRLKTRLFKIANQHLYHAAHLVTASASDSVPLLHVHAL